jgi:hypothetical protein
MSRWPLLLGVVVLVVLTLTRVSELTDPVRTSAKAVLRSTTSVRLTGSVDCGRGSPICRYYFRWGAHGAYQHRSPLSRSRGSAHGDLSTVLVTSLRPGTPYRFQICVVRSGGGADCAGPEGLASGAFTTAGCDLFASPSGSDHASGQVASPLLTVAALDGALSAGQTGCLESGSYGSTSAVHRLTNSGSSGAQITITSAPGETPKIVGLVELEGSYTTLSGLEIDGSNNAYNAVRSGTSCPAPVSNGLEIDGHNDTFQYNNFYQSIPSLRGNGIGIGWNGQANNTVIRFNRIHDLGQCQAYDQMIYLAHGNNAQIYDNWMWNDPHGWGVQVYPAASGAHIYNNVIDAAGSGFVIAGDTTVQNNVIDHNIVMNSTGLTHAGLPQGVGIFNSGPVGTGNTFTNNDVYNTPGGIANADHVTINNNTTTAPNLVDAQNHDYRTTTTSPSLLTTSHLWDGNLGARSTDSIDRRTRR